MLGERKCYICGKKLTKLEEIIRMPVFERTIERIGTFVHGAGLCDECFQKVMKPIREIDDRFVTATSESDLEIKDCITVTVSSVDELRKYLEENKGVVIKKTYVKVPREDITDAETGLTVQIKDVCTAYYVLGEKNLKVILPHRVLLGKFKK